MGPGLFDMPEADEASGETEVSTDDGMEAVAADLLAAVEAKDVRLLAELLRSVRGG